MFLSTPVKIFHAVCFLSMVFTGCSLWRSSENSATTLASPPRNEYPFVVREPEVFQAEMVIRTGENERRIFIARNGQRRRTDFDVGTDNHRSVLITDKEYLLFFNRKVFEERLMSTDAAAFYEPLSVHILSTREYASFEEINRSGRIVEFVARINESSNSEAIIFFDEAIGMPVKHELYSFDGEQRKLQYAVELKNFATTVDEATFQIPEGFKKVTRSAN